MAALVLPACAQVFNMEHNRVQMTPLEGAMRFHTGDDPRWSGPAFDDSTWPLISSESSWSAQGYKDYGGFAWYRFRVLLPPEHAQLGLYLPRIMTSYQVFADGKLVGSFGGFPPDATIYALRPKLVLLPQDQAGDLEIAIRVWHWPYWSMDYGGGLTGVPRIGDAGTLNNWAMLQDKNTFWELSAQNCSALLCLLYCIAGFALFLMRPKERVYLWYGLLGFFFFASPLVRDYAAFHDLPLFAVSGLTDLLAAAGFFCFVIFTWMLLGARRTVWVPLAGLSLLLHAAMWILPLARYLPSSVDSLIFFAIDLPSFIGPLVMLIQGVRRGDPDARLLLFPVGFNTLANWINNLLLVFVTAGYSSIKPIWTFWTQTFSWPFPFGLYDVSVWMIVLAVLGIVVLRFARSRHEEDQMKNEREAARAVQQVLIPDAIPGVPGFKIESVYKPAGEVGGDFFQIDPIASGGALIVVGDVSGKGMPAAMTVSLLVGTFRTLAHYTQSPGQILSAMNQRMLGRSNGGFTTCLILRIDPDGTVTAANAGHLVPYADGKELALENGLPIGLSAQSTYAESTFQLPPNALLTLLTDGVVEARNTQGELFGFERTQAISTQTAEEIARAAQHFGQEDDITVLTLTRLAADKASTASRAARGIA
jgi:hypothetical protein